MTAPHVANGPVAALARRYIKDLVYGANDGIITTFAVVAGVTGGQLSSRAILIVGAANLFADGLSMGVGNYLGIRSHDSAQAALNLPREDGSPVRHGLATALAFMVAGAVPLAPYAIGLDLPRFESSLVLTLFTLFAVGASRSLVTIDRWWKAGLEMLLLGIVVAAVGYGAGAAVAFLVSGANDLPL